MRLRPFLLASLVGLSALALSPTVDEPLAVRPAHATTALLMATEDLVKVSTHIVVAEPVERFSKWEEVGGSKRIVTYTRLSVLEGIVDAPKEESVWVRTLGGRVDKIGQAVAGEAEFTLNEPSVVFLAKTGDTLVVVGMAQGHFPIREVEGERVLRASPDLGHLIKRKGETRKSAQEELVGQKLSAATARIAEIAKASRK